MRGLILKDLICLKKSLFSYLGIMAVYMGIALLNPNSMSGLAAVMVMVMTMLVFSCFSIDQAAKWDSYGAALPVSRNAIVAARYGTSLITMGLGFLAAALISAGMALMANRDAALSAVLASAICFLLGVLMNAISIPLIYRFGAERARLILFGVLIGLAAVAAALLIPLHGMDLLLNLLDDLKFTRTLAVGLSAACIAFCCACLGISYGVSCLIYRKLDL